MYPDSSRPCLMIALALLMAPTLAWAGGHGCRSCPKTQCEGPLGCMIWKLVEVEFEVETIEWKEVTKEVLRPEIVAIRKPAACRVCKPVPYHYFEPICLTKYSQSKEKVVVTASEEPCMDPCETSLDAHCEVDCPPDCIVEVCEMGGHEGDEPAADSESSCDESGVRAQPTGMELITCIHRSYVPTVVPVQCWLQVPTEYPYEEVFFKQEMKTVTLKVKEPVRTTKTVKRRVWKKVPFDPTGGVCENPCPAPIECEAPCEDPCLIP